MRLTLEELGKVVKDGSFPSTTHRLVVVLLVRGSEGQTTSDLNLENP